MLAKLQGGFIYCVSLTGVTSARRTLSRATAGLVERIRQYTDLPILVGFGVSRAEHLVEIGTYAEGAAVGSALLDAIDQCSTGRQSGTRLETLLARSGGSRARAATR